MSKAPSMPMYWDAYLADTTHLTTEEHGAYMLLLAAMWRRNGWVTDSDRDNARILGLTPAKWRKIKHRLDGFLTYENGRITQKNLLKIWKNTQEKIDKNKSNGAKGGRPVSNKNNDIRKPNGSFSDNRNKTIPEPEPYIDGGDDARAREALPQSEPDQPTFRESLLAAMNVGPDGVIGPSAGVIGKRSDMEESRRWCDDLGLTEGECLAVIREVMARKRDGPPRSFSYFTDAMRRAAGEKNRANLKPIEAPDDHRNDAIPYAAAVRRNKSPHGKLFAGFAQRAGQNTGAGVYDLEGVPSATPTGERTVASGADIHLTDPLLRLGSAGGSGGTDS